MPKKNPSAAPAGAPTSEPPNGAELQIVAAGPVSDESMGQQLTAQYKRAVSGMREVLIFGAMLMQVEENVSTRGHDRSRGGGRDTKGTGLKGWLETYAPEISRPTAYRFLGITKAITAEYEGIVGRQIAKRFALPELVLAPADSLPANARLKQGELFDYVSGTSQRSWLDRYAEKEVGAQKKSKTTTREVRDIDQEIEFQTMLAKDKHQLLVVEMEEFFLSKRDKRFDLLGDADRKVILDLLIDINKSNRK